MKDFTKRIFIRTSIYFTVLTFIYALYILLMFGGSEDGGLLSSLRTVMFMVFSLVFAAANEMLRSQARRGLWVTLHAVITGAGFYFFMILPAGISGTTALVGMLLYYSVYAVVAAILLTRATRTKKKKNREKEYQSMIGNH